MAFTHTIRPRYGEGDKQGVVSVSVEHGTNRSRPIPDAVRKPLEEAPV